MKYVWRTNNITVYNASDIEGVGRTRQVGGSWYKWLRNSTGGALTVNRVYCFGTGNTTGYSFGQEVFTFGQAAKGTAINFGMYVAQSAVPDGYFGWFQFKGPSVVGVEGTAAVAASDNLKMVTGQTYLVKDTAAGTAPTNHNSAIALAAQGSAGSTDTAVWLVCGD